MRIQNFPTNIVGVMLLLVSCSSPRYTYNFDYYDYNSGRKKLPNTYANESLPVYNSEPLKLDGNQLVAASDPVVVMDARQNSFIPKEMRAAEKAYKDLSNAEKKELRKEVKDYIKNHSKQRKNLDEGATVHATKQLDDDLKLSIIFGAIGITFAILGGINTVFWVIGVIGLIIGLVFFIRWISTQ